MIPEDNLLKVNTECQPMSTEILQGGILHTPYPLLTTFPPVFQQK